MRIVAGIAKGRKIESPKGTDVRPTSDRVREALFSSIAFRIPGSRVLDLFAGTGALGLESLSRGAAETIFVDCSRRSIEIIRKNIEICGFISRCTVFNNDAKTALERFSRQPKHKFDLIFLDPPYVGSLLENALTSLVDSSLIDTKTLIIAEHPSNRTPMVPDSLSITSTKRYGNTALSFVQQISDLEAAEQ